MVKNPPSGAGDAGSIPGRGIKISHASEVLSPHTAPREYVLSKACASRQDKLCPSHTHTPQQRLSTTGKKKNKTLYSVHVLEQLFESLAISPNLGPSSVMFFRK